MPSATYQYPYVYNNNQIEAVRLGSSLEEGGSQAEMAVTQFKEARRVYRGGDGRTWYVDKHDGEVAEAIVGNTYTPDIRVRGISAKNLSDDTAVMVIKFDEPKAAAVIEQFVIGIDRPFWVTRLYLSETTTCTDINLHG